MAEVLRCPACGAADTSKAGKDGVHTCVFCGVRYTHGAPPAVAAPTVSRPAPAQLLSPRARIAAVVTGLVLAAFMIVTGRWDPERAPKEVPPVVVPVSTPVTVEAPPPEPPASATFVEHSVLQRGSDGTYYVLGVVTNTSPWPIESPKFEVVLKDATGKEVGVDTGFGGREALPPGGSQAVSLLVYKPISHASHEVVVRPERLDWQPEPAEGLTVSPFPPVADTYGGWKVSGSVTNGGAVTARFVEAYIAAWNAEDKLIGLAHTFAAGEEGLAAGATARYDTRLDAEGTPARFTVEVSGRK